MCRCFHWILWLAERFIQIFRQTFFSANVNFRIFSLYTRIQAIYIYSKCVGTIYVNFSHCLFTNFNNVVDLQFKLIGQLYWVWWFWHRKMKQAVINIISTSSVVVYICANCWCWWSFFPICFRLFYLCILNINFMLR